MINYLRSVGREFRNIKWPSAKIAIQYTLIVIFLSFLVAIYIGVLDIAFINIVERFLI